MKRLLVFFSSTMFIACHPVRTVAAETGLSVDDSGAPVGTPAPHIAPPGAGNLPQPITTNTTPVTGTTPLQGGVPSHEVQPGEETPQPDENAQTMGSLRPPRGGLVEEKDGGTDGGSGGNEEDKEGGAYPPENRFNPSTGGDYVPFSGGSSGGDGTQTEDMVFVEGNRVRGVDTPLSANQGLENSSGDPQSGEVAPPQNPLKNQMTGGAAGTLPPKGSSLPDMPAAVDNSKKSEADLFPDEKAGGAPLDGLSKTPPTSAPAAVGQISKPASKPVSEATPTLVEKGPGPIVIPRENCGTHHTGWVDDPNADVNPCPTHCERGERLWINSHVNGNKTQYDGVYRCYLPELIIEPPPLAALPPGAPLRRNCGTVWTGREADPLADVNPCPANCERGELRGVRRGRSDDALYFEMSYQCYVAEPGTKSVSASTAQAGAGRSSGSKPVIPVTGVTQGVRVADGQTATSTSAVDTVPAASALKHPAVVEREVSTRNITPGPTLLAVTGEDATTASVIWRPLPGASVYKVHAKATGINHSLTGPEVRQPVLDSANQPGLPSAMNYLLSGLAPGVEHNVWVTAKYPDGSSGTSDLRTVTTRGAENPAGFMAFPIVMPGIPGSVRLEWQLRRGATHYLVEGSNLPRTPTTNTTFVVPDIRTAGTHSWTVIAVYPGGVYDDRHLPRASVTCALSGSEQRVVCSRDRSP